MNEAKKALIQASTSATVCRSFLYLRLLDEVIDDGILFTLRTEIDDLIRGLEISLQILGDSSDVKK